VIKEKKKKKKKKNKMKQTTNYNKKKKKNPTLTRGQSPIRIEKTRTPSLPGSVDHTAKC